MKRVLLTVALCVAASASFAQKKDIEIKEESYRNHYSHMQENNITSEFNDVSADFSQEYISAQMKSWKKLHNVEDDDESPNEYFHPIS